LWSTVLRCEAREYVALGMSRVEGARDLPQCTVCRRVMVRARRGDDGVPVVLCLACDAGPLVEKARAALTDAQRRALNL